MRGPIYPDRIAADTVLAAVPLGVREHSSRFADRGHAIIGRDHRQHDVQPERLATLEVGIEEAPVFFRYHVSTLGPLDQIADAGIEPYGRESQPLGADEGRFSKRRRVQRTRRRHTDPSVSHFLLLQRQANTPAAIEMIRMVPGSGTATSRSREFSSQFGPSW